MIALKKQLGASTGCAPSAGLRLGGIVKLMIPLKCCAPAETCSSHSGKTSFLF